VVGENCDARWVRQYGGQLYLGTWQRRYFEKGNALAQLDSDRGGLVITGKTSSRLLVFRLEPDGDLEWMKHYNMNTGHAIQVVTGKDGRKKIWVAGEWKTNHFPDGTNLWNSERPETWDAFLVEIRLDGSGRPFPEVFGLLPGVDNGALSPGKLDMHLTRAKNPRAIIMGNAFLYENTTSNTPTTYPYLVERYRKVEDHCQDTRFKWAAWVHSFVADIHAIVRNKKTLKSTKLDLAMTLRTLNETIPCPTSVVS